MDVSWSKGGLGLNPSVDLYGLILGSSLWFHSKWMVWRCPNSGRSGWPYSVSASDINRPDSIRRLLEAVV
jgi:hypothetical protein